MSDVPVTLARPVSGKVFSAMMEQASKEQKQIYKDAMKLAEKLADIITQALPNIDKQTYSKLALTLLTAVRMYLYTVAEMLYKDKVESRGDQPAKRLTYIKVINDVVESAWDVAKIIIACKDCKEDQPPIYM